MARKHAGIGCLLLLCASMAQADTKPADDAGAVSYYKQIRPIFQAHCQGCHQPAKAGGEYVMTDFARLIAGGESGEPAITAGKADESYLLGQITPSDGEAEMPKGKPPLADSEIKLIERWVAEGAKDDTPASAAVRYDREHPPTYTLPPVVTALDFSPDGKLLAVSGANEVLVHRADGSERVARLIGMSERIESIEFSPDGSLLAVTGGLPARMGEVQVWDMQTHELKLSVPVTYDTVYGASWSPDGKLIAFGCGDNTARAIDTATGKEVLYCGASTDWILDSTFSTDGSHLIVVGRDMTAKLIEVRTQRFVDNITSITPGALKGGLCAVDRHPTKDEILVGGSDGAPKTYLIYRTKKRVIGDDHQKIRDYEALPGRVYAVGYSPDGTKVAAGSSLDGSGELRLYETDSGKLLWKHRGTPVYALAYRPDGAVIAAAGFDGKVRLLSAADGKLLHEFVPVPLEQDAVATK